MNTLIRQCCNRYGKELPENLESGAVCVSNTGTVGIVVRTAHKTRVGERIYRLRFTYKFSSGRVFTMKTERPYVETRRTAKGMVPYKAGYGWTRDELEQMGCRYIRKADVGISKVMEYIPLFGD